MKRAGTLVTLGVVAVVLFLGVSIMSGYDERVDGDYERAEAYCLQVYNDSSVVNSLVVGSHSGLHCAANEEGPHLHDIPQKYQEQALNATQRGENINWTVETAQKQKVGSRIPVIGFRVFEVAGAIGAAVLVLVLVIVFSEIKQYKGDSK